MSARLGSIRRRLIIRPGGIGDCILSLPAIEHLRVEYTEVWVPSAIVPIIRCAEARTIASTRIDLLGLSDMEPPSGLIAKLGSFDSIVSWYGSNRPEFREHVAALGLPFQFLDALPRLVDKTSAIHAADFFLRQVGGEGRAIPRIDCGPVEQGNFAIIHPFSGSARKNWPLERFRELASRLPLPVCWCAGPEEMLEGAERFDNLFDLARWLGAARLYLGNDSGISHLAAAAGVPTVAIFGPSDPDVWSPRGKRVAVVSGELEHIAVNEVLAAVCRLIT